jgi:enoyl-CoA hydratase
MIRTQVEDNIAVVTIDRPEVHNALGTDDLMSLKRTVRECIADNAVGVIVLTGAGGKSFVAGGDIADLNTPLGVNDALSLPMQSIFDEIASSPKPTIAAINGYAFGGGFELALACDMRIASENASLALPELGWSVLPAAGGVTRLTRLAGPGRALEIILTGRRVGAAEALSAGIVTKVVSAGSLMEETLTVARQILNKGPVAVRVARLAVKVAAEGGAGAGLIAESLGLALLFGTDDKAEGTSAFLEKRSPQFTGK